MSNDKKDEGHRDNIVSLVENTSPPPEEEELKILSALEVLLKMEAEGGIEEVIIIGLDEDGQMGIGSNLPTTSQVNMLLDAAKINLLSTKGVHIG